MIPMLTEMMTTFLKKVIANNQCTRTNISAFLTKKNRVKARRVVLRLSFPHPQTKKLLATSRWIHQDMNIAG